MGEQESESLCERLITRSLALQPSYQPDGAQKPLCCRHLLFLLSRLNFKAELQPGAEAAAPSMPPPPPPPTFKADPLTSVKFSQGNSDMVEDFED